MSEEMKIYVNSAKIPMTSAKPGEETCMYIDGICNRVWPYYLKSIDAPQADELEDLSTKKVVILWSICTGCIIFLLLITIYLVCLGMKRKSSSSMRQTEKQACRSTKQLVRGVNPKKCKEETDLALIKPMFELHKPHPDLCTRDNYTNAKSNFLHPHSMPLDPRRRLIPPTRSGEYQDFLWNIDDDPTDTESDDESVTVCGHEASIDSRDEYAEKGEVQSGNKDGEQDEDATEKQLPRQESTRGTEHDVRVMIRPTGTYNHVDHLGESTTCAVVLDNILRRPHVFLECLVFNTLPSLVKSPTSVAQIEGTTLIRFPLVASGDSMRIRSLL